jgi:hypothetical protein
MRIWHCKQKGSARRPVSAGRMSLTQDLFDITIENKYATNSEQVGSATDASDDAWNQRRTKGKVKS